MEEFQQPTPIQEINYRRDPENGIGGTYLDLLRGEHLSKQDLRSVIETVDGLNSAIILNRNPDIPSDRNICGVLFQAGDEDVWTATYLFDSLGAWASTYQSDDKEIVRELHNAYIIGYADGRFYPHADRELIDFDNPFADEETEEEVVSENEQETAVSSAE